MHIETIDVNNNNNDLNPLANSDSNEEPLEYPLLKNIDEQPNVYVQRCGHCMHDDCFTSFFSSIIKRHFQFVFQQVIFREKILSLRKNFFSYSHQ